jgi:hypothetical protein
MTQCWGNVKTQCPKKRLLFVMFLVDLDIDSVLTNVDCGEVHDIASRKRFICIYIAPYIPWSKLDAYHKFSDSV